MPTLMKAQDTTSHECGEALLEVEDVEPPHTQFSWRELLRFVGPGLLMSIAYVVGWLSAWVLHYGCGGLPGV